MCKRQFGGKRDSRRHPTTKLYRECRGSGIKGLEVRGFVILRLEDDLISSNKDNRARFWGGEIKVKSRTRSRSRPRI